MKRNIYTKTWSRKWTILLSHFLILSFSQFLISCSETKNLAEDETLYVGIKELAYDRNLKSRVQAGDDEREGVITSMANAYHTVSGLLTGNASLAEALKQKGLTKQQKDSIKVAFLQDRKAYATAKEEVEGALKRAPNNSLMGSSYYRFPLPVGLWIYNKYVYRDTRWSRWMMNNFAATPVYLTTVNPRVRTQVAQNTLRNYGYFHGTVDYQTQPQKNPRKAKVSYEVHPGELFHFDSIAYQHFPLEADSMIRATGTKTLLHQGDPFSVVTLDAERTRLCNLFRDNGYYFFQTNYITYRADTLMRPQFVQLQVRPAADMPTQARRQYYMGHTRINLYDYEATQLTDTLRPAARKPDGGKRKPSSAGPRREAPSASSRQGARRSITLAHSGKPGRSPLKMRAIRRYLRYRPGELYSQSVQKAVQTNLSDMGIFSQLTMQYEPRDTLSDTLDVLITARLDKPYDAEFRGNVASKSNGLVGPGASFSMSRMNAFRGAEKVSLDLYGSYEWQTGAQMKGQSQVVNSYEYGASLNLHFPRLTLLTLGKRLSRRAQASTTYKLDADWMNRSGYFGRVSFGARIAYSYQRLPTVRHELVPFRLNYDMQLHTTARFDSIIAANQALYVSMRDQFVPSMQYTLQMSSRATARNPRSFTLVAKEAGNVTSGLYRAFGQDWHQTNKHLFGVPFAQYFKLTAEFTEKYKIRSTRTYLAARLFAGAVVSYGNSTIAPYSDLFSIGGANSIRAFGVRSIGPGSYHPGHSGYSYIDNVGDLKLEANVEYRFPLVANLYGALFLDAGNVWLMKPDESHPGGSINLGTFGREIALGTGFGFRYDLQFLVIRFDVGIGLHAPYDTGRRGYYNMLRFWNSVGYHIAVGYPF